MVSPRDMLSLWTLRCVRVVGRVQHTRPGISGSHRKTARFKGNLEASVLLGAKPLKGRGSGEAEGPVKIMAGGEENPAWDAIRSMKL